MIKKNILLTKKNSQTNKAVPLAVSLDLDTPQEPYNPATGNIFVSNKTNSNIKNKSYRDQTGKLLHISSRGNQPIMVLYDYDTNLLLITPLPYHQYETITSGWKRLHERLCDNRLSLTLHILDKECSEDMRKAFQKYKVKFELVPPHIHRRNAAELSTQTWRNHFLAAINSINPAFPIK